jgi:hypothetical protein
MILVAILWQGKRNDRPVTWQPTVSYPMIGPFDNACAFSHRGPSKLEGLAVSDLSATISPERATSSHATYEVSLIGRKDSEPIRAGTRASYHQPDGA